MTDRPVLDVTEERLRRMFERRAEDMALGDGVEWDPRPVTPIVLAQPFRERAVRRPHRRTLVAVIAAVIIPAVVGVGVLALAGDEGGEPNRPAGATQDTSPSSAAVTTTAPPDPEVTDPAAPPTSTDESTAETTPCTPVVPGRQRDDPNLRTLADYVSPEQGPDGHPLRIHIYQFTDSGFRDYPGAEPIQAGDNSGIYVPLSGHDAAIHLSFGELGVGVQGNIPKEELVAVAATIRRGAEGNIEHTRPAGYEQLPFCRS